MTVRETLLPAAMVPGLVTVEDSKGKRQNLYPIDAKELLAGGEYKLVENGAVEAARMAATPLRSGMAAGIPDDQLVVEISGVEGRVVTAEDGEAVRAESAGIDGTTDQDDAAPVNAKDDPASAARIQSEARASETKTDTDKAAPARIPAKADADKK